MCPWESNTATSVVARVGFISQRLNDALEGFGAAGSHCRLPCTGIETDTGPAQVDPDGESSSSRYR